MSVCYYVSGRYSSLKGIGGICGIYICPQFCKDCEMILQETKVMNVSCKYLSIIMAIRHAIDNNYYDIKIFTTSNKIFQAIQTHSRGKYFELFECIDSYEGYIEWVKIKSSLNEIMRDKDSINLQKLNKSIEEGILCLEFRVGCD